MATRTRKEMIDQIAHDTGQPRTTVRALVQQLLNEVIHDLGQGNRLELRNFGVFEIKQQRSRIGHNPKTGEKVEVPPRPTVKFKPGRHMCQVLESADAREGYTNVAGSTSTVYVLQLIDVSPLPEHGIKTPEIHEDTDDVK
jgi:integration host factor subunit beta